MTDHRKLERLLDLRRHEENRRAVQLAMARRALLDAQTALENLENQRRELESTTVENSRDSVGQWKTVRLLIEQLDHGIHNARTVVVLAEASLSEKVEELETATRNREALERILIPRHAQTRALERLAEQKHADEVAAHRFRTGEQAS